ncbi:MAG: YihY/virulence factor BrkB family protein [Candidatus Eremiobacteraeota bacterium]|nr:YihY/virulence factor BrkB family protein [Candidatus Eremiobacteraeota bacterium]
MKRLILAFREAGIRFSRDGCAFLAQAIAFNALFTLFPLAYLAITAASYVYPDSQQRVLQFVDTLAPELHDYIAQNLQTYFGGRVSTSLIAFGFLAWSGKNLFMALAYALDRALGVPKSRPLLHSFYLSIVMLPFMGALLVAAMALPILVSFVVRSTAIGDQAQVTQIFGYGISLLVVFFVMIVMYTFLPNRSVVWHFAVPGASFAALTWPLVQFLFAWYTAHVDFGRVYGALSAPLALLLWFYLTGSIFLFGAELCAGWAHLKGTTPVAALEDEA